MNNNGNFGQKLYLEPAYVKEERFLLKIMLENNKASNYVLNNINCEELILDCHKKIYKLIVDYIDFPVDERKSRIELKCDDTESLKEWININETDILVNDENIDILIQDCIKGIRRHKLIEMKKNIMKKIKESEMKGLVEESVNLVQEYAEVQSRIRDL